MTGFTALTTTGELEFPHATNQVHKKHGVELRKPPKMAVADDTKGPVAAFLPYQNLIAVLPMEEGENDEI